MPWSPESFKKRHNKKLTASKAKAAAAQANAILNKTGDEGLAIAVANKNAQKKTPIHEKMYKKPDGEK